MVNIKAKECYAIQEAFMPFRALTLVDLYKFS